MDIGQLSIRKGDLVRLIDRAFVCLDEPTYAAGDFGVTIVGFLSIDQDRRTCIYIFLDPNDYRFIVGTQLHACQSCDIEVVSRFRECADQGI